MSAERTAGALDALRWVSDHASCEGWDAVPELLVRRLGPIALEDLHRERTAMLDHRPVDEYAGGWARAITDLLTLVVAEGLDRLETEVVVAALDLTLSTL